MEETVELSQKDTELLIPRRVTQVPPIEESVVKQLCVQYFGLNPERIDRLNSYDDRNYRLSKVASLATNPYLNTVCSDGYVLKITNAEESLTPNLLEGQNALLNHFKAKGLPVSELVPSRSGRDLIRVHIKYSKANDDSATSGIHAVRLMHYIPGHLLCHVPVGTDTLFKIGKLLARAHNATRNFQHPSFDGLPTSHWSLYNFGHLQDVLCTIEDPPTQRMILDIIDAFRVRVTSQTHKMETGQIHGDFNEQNILVHQDGHGVYNVCGLLDIGDTHRSCLIFDVAVAMVYVSMLDVHDVPFQQVGGHLLAGYFSERKIPAHEAHLIRLCMCARYCQSLVYGLHTYMQNPVPDNEYVLLTQKKGWPQLTELWKVTDSDLYEPWRRILSTYGIENAF